MAEKPKAAESDHTHPEPESKGMPEPETAMAPEPETKEKPLHKCPHCKGELLEHGSENPYKAGALHCNRCGSCWNPDLKTQRDGHAGPTEAHA